jgi:protein-S-isoprenylcysteine O-methyltransferase Ste14
LHLPANERYDVKLVRPIAAHDLTAGLLLAATVLGAGLIEWLVRSRSTARGRTAPEWTFFVVIIVILACIAGAVVASLDRVASMPGGVWWPLIAGIALMMVGAGLRIWSVATLGRYFKLMVVIQDDHRVIDRGPYRHVRHPAYLGTCIYIVGLGLVASDWVALGVLLIPFTALFVMRIQVEERALLQALGGEYTLYMQRTARLVPGVY